MSKTKKPVRAEKRELKKKKKINPVSGKSVFALKKIINRKSNLK